MARLPIHVLRGDQRTSIYLGFSMSTVPRTAGGSCALSTCQNFFSHGTGGRGSGDRALDQKHRLPLVHPLAMASTPATASCTYWVEGRTDGSMKPQKRQRFSATDLIHQLRANKELNEQKNNPMLGRTEQETERRPRK